MQNTKLANALAITSKRLFQIKSYDPKSNAQQNLSGRTYWADESTLKGFKSRITTSQKAADGLLFIVVESNGSKPFEQRMNKRALVFDVFGDIVNERDEWTNTSDKALKSALAFVATYDAEANAIAKLTKEAAALKKQAEETLAALS